METEIGTFEGKTAQEWREVARQARQRSAESFERCDTDGFLSQWASDTMARKYDLAAELADNEGTWEFPAVFDLDGRLLAWRMVETCYGVAWPQDLPGGGTRWHRPSEARKAKTRRANDAKKSIVMGTVRAAAWIRTCGSATSVQHIPTPQRDAAPVIVDNGSLGTRYTIDY